MSLDLEGAQEDAALPTTGWLTDQDPPGADADTFAFFAPAPTSMVASLVAEYRLREQRIRALAMHMESPETLDALHYFLNGNRTEERGRFSMELSAAQLFGLDGAIGSLRASYWSKALHLTDVLDAMPQKRRDEWNDQIRHPLGKRLESRRWSTSDENAQDWAIQPLPDFTEDNANTTLAGLLAMRAQFLSERVDGIFRGLSHVHVTNCPEAFSKRMIIAGVLSSSGYSCHSTAGLINDLRCVIAKFMGRDEPKHWVSAKLVDNLRCNTGQWVTIDGGALRIRVYKKGTAHLEVHPDMAWRLNMVLAHMHPLAIPPEFRQRPKRKPKEWPMLSRPLPFTVLDALSDLDKVLIPVGPEHLKRHERLPRAVRFSCRDIDQTAKKQAGAVLEALGGTHVAQRYPGYYVFDYEPWDVIREVIASGCIPDQQSHQYFPTPELVAADAMGIALIGATDSTTWLEPEAGQGNLAALMPNDRTTCVEISALHCAVLKARGLSRVIQADFLVWAPGAPQFDRIVMNPPFSEGRALAHTQAAAGLVKPQGVLVAILPASKRDSISLPGFEVTWSRVYSNEFAGTSAQVAIMTAHKLPTP